ncbi:MAG: phosphoserine phosphatase SerB [endosymbiont of Galathealinum brachiosum]|uniref:Phosphoserine phosphatase n=1 Tax=endosymbiont of Galathealinum brachiosum TaxID=2200906 RepID=A0A370DHP6_9GAMM|nr:MAG: phosphoserine phosphatase SerB [endosymbiont of Galathealinum brachiosum]
MSEVVLITISGQDRAGLTSALMSILSSYDINILDIGQSVIHESLSLGFLIESPEDAKSCSVFKDILFKAHELNLNARFTPITKAEYEHWVNAQGQAKHIVTLLGRQITAKHLSRVTEVVKDQGFNIDQISRLSGRLSLSQQGNSSSRGASVQLSLTGDVQDIAAMHASFLHISQELDLDIAVQEDNLYRRSRRLVCFDMDSTLIQVEVIDELAKAAGVGDQVAKITESAMRGEIDFSESFRQRMALLKGMDESVLKEIAESLPITEGAARLIRHLRHFGYKVAILSGGFTYFAEYLKEKLGVDYVYANQLDFENGKLTGKVKGEIVDGQMKAKLLTQIAQQEGISTEQVIAVGDGANDLPMLAIAGLGIAFHAKPLVKEQAKHSITNLGLDAILYLLGIRDRELVELENSLK